VNSKLNQRVAVAHVSGYSEPLNRRSEIADFSVSYRDILRSTGISGMECLSQPGQSFVNILAGSVAEEHS
jgi:hypothetical protein